MARAHRSTIPEQLHNLVDNPGASLGTDADLLQRYVSRQDETAFAALVHRHGSLVLRVGHHVLQDHAAAEDAFQATFLVLARKAKCMRQCRSLAGWLHEVAFRTALSIRKSAMRRRKHEEKAVARPPDSPVATAALQELQALLDEEVQRLPDRYRVPFVLCCLEGRSRSEAAQELGWNEGTVSSRLARARALLQGRLARRGVALSAVLCAATLSLDATAAAVSSPLMTATVQGALAFLAGKAPGTISSQVSAVAETVLKDMSLARVKSAAVLLALLGVLVAAGVMVCQAASAHLPEATPGEQGPALAGQPAPVKGEPNTPRPQDQRRDLLGDPLPEGAAARMSTARFWSDCRWIYNVAFDAEGKQLVSVGRDNKMRIWDVTTGKELRQFPAAGIPGSTSPPIASFAVSADGKLLAYMGMNNGNVSGKFHVMELATGKTISTITVGLAGVFTFSPNNKTLAVAGFWDGQIRFFRVATGKEFAQLDAKKERVTALVYSPDQRTLAAANGDNTITLWDTPTEKKILDLPGHQGLVLAIAFAADGATLIAAGQDQTARVWDVAKGTEMRSFPVVRGRQAFFSPDCRQLAVVDELNAIVFYDVASGKELGRWRGAVPTHSQGEDGFVTVAFSPEGKTVALGGGERIDLRVAATGAEVFPGHTSAVHGVALSPDGLILATTASDGLRLWETTTGKERGKIAINGSTIHAFAFTGDSRTLAVVAGDAVLLGDAATGKEMQRFSVAVTIPSDPTTPALRVYPNGSLSADGRRVAVAAPDGIHVWDVASGNKIRHIAVKVTGKDRLQSVTLSADGRIVASLHIRRTSADARGESYVTIKLWEVATGKLLHQLESNGPLVFSPDGRTLATVGNGVVPDIYAQHLQDRQVRLWDLTTAKVLHKLDAAAPLAFSPDGKTLLSAGAKGSIRFWNTATGKVEHDIQGPQVRVTALAVAPDAKVLVSGGADTTALIWQWPDLGNAGPPANGKVRPEELEALWTDLASDNPTVGYRAIGAMLAAPKQAVACLQGHLKPAAAVDPQRLTQFIADLNSDQFKVRQQATNELEKLGERAAPALKRALAGKPTLEAQQRVERLLEILKVRGSSPETLRVIRACAVLEAVNTPQTRKVLQVLAAGAADDLGTQEAQATLARLARRPVAKQ
jgi:RNA polymerase sigma factor (sigma-70 family)